MKLTAKLTSVVLLSAAATLAHAETIRIAIGTQDSTINCATGGLVIREEKLLEKYLPHDGKYKDVKYDITWSNFTSGAPLTNEMVADKLDIGSMADFPGSMNRSAFEQAGKRSLFVTVLSGSTEGSGNGIVVPADSQIQSIADLKGKQISVPFASTAHGMLLRALKAEGIDPDRDLTLVAQPPEVAGPALQTSKIDAHADFVPFAELFPWRGYARKIYDGSQAKAPTFHGTLVSAEYAKKHPEIVVAFLRAAIEADRLVTAEPEKYSELIQKVAGVDAEVAYLYHGPLGLQTRDFTWKPEYRQALQTSIDTLKLLKKTDRNIDIKDFIDDSYLLEAFKQSGLDYQKSLSNYNKSPLLAKDAISGKAITDFSRVAQVWVKGEPKVRSYENPENAFSDVKKLKAAGKEIRVVYVLDSSSHIKLLAKLAWFTTDAKGQVHAFLQKGAADTFAQANKTKVVDFTQAQQLQPTQISALQ
jgi:NitT/TauT family transport system substrate-binding protein